MDKTVSQQVHSVGHKDAPGDRPKMGRGRLLQVVKFRLNRKQLKWLDACAANSGLDRSEYIRSLLGGERPRSSATARLVARQNELLALLANALLGLRTTAVHSGIGAHYLLTLDAILAEAAELLDSLHARSDSQEKGPTP